jgi:hypothetical protein
LAVGGSAASPSSNILDSFSENNRFLKWAEGGPGVPGPSHSSFSSGDFSSTYRMEGYIFSEEGGRHACSPKAINI